MPAEPRSRTLTLRRPTDLGLTLGILQRGRGDPTMRVDPAEVWRAGRTPAGPVTLRLRGGGERVEATAWGPGGGWALTQLPTLLGGADDDGDFHPVHPLVHDLHRRLHGLRICRTEAVVDALVALVLEQKVTGVAARRAWARLVRGLGEPAPGPLPGLRLPAEPVRLATTPTWRYHTFGVEQRRAETLRRIGALAGRLEETIGMPTAAARERLLAVPGIGPWTQAWVAMLALGDADAVPVGDFNLPHMVSWTLAGEPRGDDARMLELLEPFTGQRGRVLRLLSAAHLGAPRRGPRLADPDLARR
ncbi:MAG TPA: DNA-3-methyladenine glycosylase 2 family protein [Candidatus Dormibacteraeota bacterium]